MLNNEKISTNNINKLIKWINSNPKEWEYICNGFVQLSSLVILIDIIKKLQQESLHEIIILIIFQNLPVFSNYLAPILLENYSNNMDNQNIIELENNFIRSIQLCIENEYTEEHHNIDI